MSKHRLSFILVTGLAAVLACAGSPAPVADTASSAAESVYTEKSPSSDGIGKVYMGREIAFVLGHRGIPWLERAERDSEEQPDVLMDNLDLAPDAVIADIGAGSGYMTFRLSRKVPQGTVLAVDIQQEMLDEIERRMADLGVENVETVLGTLVDPGLPPGQVDAALMVDAYHEFSYPREMMEGLVRGLRPGGRVFLVEYRGEDPDLNILPLHKMTQAQAKLEMAAAGLEWVETLDVLPTQHLMVFRKKS
jgi:protein-L-isoaspartate O-methyltransferase